MKTLKKANLIPKQIKVADLIGKDVTGIRGDVRGGRHDWAGPLVRTLTKVTRCTEKRNGQKSTWIRIYWTPEPRSDGYLDCGYSGWEESYFKKLRPVVIIN
jgi:hypothetical protein